MIRVANLDDLDRLVELENRCFDSDLMIRRSFRYMLTKANASTLVVDDCGSSLGGYVLTLFSRGTALARLYSIAVDAGQRGKGTGLQLLAAAEAEALERGCVSMRSEIRRDNPASIGLFKRAGYREFDQVEDYYEDHMQALRFERTIAEYPDSTRIRVSFYRQTTDFTCGPAALMMAMHALDPKVALTRRLELRLWRESTSIYMTSGHGGCGPYGLALAAHLRGFNVEVHVKEKGVFLADTVRAPHKKEVMRVVEMDYLAQLAERGVKVMRRPLGFDELQERFRSGSIPVLLISSHRIYAERFPHWVVVMGFDERFVWVHDPFVDQDEGETVSDSVAMPIARRELERMVRLGRAGQRAVVLVSARRPDESAVTASRRFKKVSITRR